jgi:hypothetical protein
MMIYGMAATARRVVRRQMATWPALELRNKVITAPRLLTIAQFENNPDTFYSPW